MASKSLERAKKPRRTHPRKSSERLRRWRTKWRLLGAEAQLEAEGEVSLSLKTEQEAVTRLLLLKQIK